MDIESNIAKYCLLLCHQGGAVLRRVKMWKMLILVTLPLPAFGLGSRIPNQDAEAIGRGNAFAATADNPSAMYYNPAGIGQLDGTHLQVGSLFYLNINSDYDSPSGQRTENIRKVIAVPQAGATMQVGDTPLTLGVGVYAPFGLGMEWPDKAPFRNAGLEAAITYIKLNPVIAWKILPNLAIAAGPTFDYSQAKLRQGVAVSPYEFKFKGDDFNFGFNAGILWQPGPKWSFGARYLSATEMNYKGDATFSPPANFLPPNFSTTAHLDFPQIVSGGISFRPNTNWNFEVDVDWTDWDQVKNVVIKNVGTLQLNWQSSFFYEAGATYYLGKGYYISGGYFYSEASTPDRNYTPLVPDTNLHVVSAGFGFKGQNWDMAFAAQYIFGGFRHINNAADPTVNGSYRLWTPTISFSIGYHF